MPQALVDLSPDSLLRASAWGLLPRANGLLACWLAGLLAYLPACLPAGNVPLGWLVYPFHELTALVLKESQKLVVVMTVVVINLSCRTELDDEIDDVTSFSALDVVEIQRAS